MAKKINTLYDFYRQSLKSGGWAKVTNMIGGAATTSSILVYFFEKPQPLSLQLLEGILLFGVASRYLTKRTGDQLASYRAVSPKKEYSELIADYARSVKLRGTQGLCNGTAAGCFVYEAMKTWQSPSNADWKILLGGTAFIFMGYGYNASANKICKRLEAMSNDPQHFYTRFLLPRKDFN